MPYNISYIGKKSHSFITERNNFATGLKGPAREDLGRKER